jgi:Xaa-Pro aminopeptidase
MRSHTPFVAVWSAVAMIGAACQKASTPAVAATTAPQQAATRETGSKFPTHREVFSPANFRGRRERLGKEIPEGVAVLIGAMGVIDAWEEHRNDPTYRVQPVRQEENLFFLTGLSGPGLAAIVDPKTSSARVYTLHVTPDIEADVKRLGLDGPLPMDRFDHDVEEQIKGRPVYLLVRSPQTASTRAAFGGDIALPAFIPGGAAGTYPEDQYRALFQKRFPSADIRSIVPVMEKLRSVNDREEVEALRRTVKISADGLRAGLAVVAPGMDEREVAAEIEHMFRRSGAQLVAYGADIQSGPNGMKSFIELFGSYDTGNRTMKDGEFVLVDHSAEVNYYVCDLARTVPVSGRFSDDQKIAYGAYLAAYEAGLAQIRAGNPYMRAAQAAAEAMKQRIPQLPEWMRAPAETFVQRTAGHRPGHFLGMNLHTHEDYDSPLEPGHVVAYEPTLQVPARGWRITVEESVLVTENGNEVLSSSLPRSIEGLEALLTRKATR